MTVRFRNLSVSPDDPVTDWPVEAIQTVLERGDIDDWRRLVVEIRVAPWGPIARGIEEVLTYTRPYGVTELMEDAIARARADSSRQEVEAVAAEIGRLVDRSGLSRADFASCIGTSTSRLSTYLSGKVTPSAAMLVRMRSAAERAARAGVRSAGRSR